MHTPGSSRKKASANTNMDIEGDSDEDSDEDDDDDDDDEDSNDSNEESDSAQQNEENKDGDEENKDGDDVLDELLSEQDKSGEMTQLAAMKMLEAFSFCNEFADTRYIRKGISTYTKQKEAEVHL